ncbi:DUF3592 domain-containing protein [Streptomyces termitum]|uniref:DUF3592 domain-containing protein n=1 Tax=Streptomyces termitum TaxID=67368 RepID=UPI0037AB638D
MDWNVILRLWCAVWGVLALAGYGAALAGPTGERHTVRAAGRVVRVREPRHGGSRRDGVSVVVAYRDPDSGREVLVTNEGERGTTFTAAWEGREVGIVHPEGRPHAYRFTPAGERPGRGLGRPALALFLACAGLVALVAVERGWPWALIGGAGPCAVYAAALLPGAARDRRKRRAELAAMEAVRGRIVAVLRDVSVDQDDGHVLTTLTPVVSFTTRAGTVVTAHWNRNLPDAASARGREVTVHHAPDDPADFTLDMAAEHRSRKGDAALHVLTVAVLAAAAVTGAVLL